MTNRAGYSSSASDKDAGGPHWNTHSTDSGTINGTGIQEVGNLDVSGDCFGVTRLRIFPKGMLLAFPANDAPAAPEMPDQRFTFHPTTTSSCFASGGMERNDSSRRCSRIMAIASRRFARHSSRVAP